MCTCIIVTRTRRWEIHQNRVLHAYTDDYRYEIYVYKRTRVFKSRARQRRSEMSYVSSNR